MTCTLNSWSWFICCGDFAAWNKCLSATKVRKAFEISDPARILTQIFFFFFNKTCDLKGSCTPDDSHWTQQQKLQRLLNTATTNTSYEDQQHQTVHVWWQVVADLELLKKPWVIVLLRPFPGGIWLTVPLIMVPVVQWPSLSSQASIWHDPSTLTVQAICHVSACC